MQRLLDARLFRVDAASQDWHPQGHVSFASEHEGRQPFETIELHGQEQTLWPDHCVQGSDGARLYPAIDWDHADVIIRDGSDPNVDSYSGFRDNCGRNGDRPPTGLAGYLRELAITDLFVCGLARDVCVKWTAEDGAAGFNVHVIWDLTRPVTYDSDEQTRADLERAGVPIVGLADLPEKSG